ncbi:MAG: cysteine--tRNA ligase [Minisyncoccia bacterium]
MAAIYFFNTLHKKKEKFIPIHKKTVGLYTCGPTVYNYAHIGNLKTFIFEDILQRTLEWNKYKVKRVMNITDVGHLTSDADEGEDKIEKTALIQKQSPEQIAKFFTLAFLKDIKLLNIKKPQYLAPATKYIKQQINIIKILIAKGYAYETSQAIYFNVKKFKNYNKLSHQNFIDKKIAARQEVVFDSEKINPQDFVLWFKLVGKFKNHIMRWLSPWGLGFPGWHIECSAISTSILGQPFDIHTGGVDHIAIHHTNEIAQSEAAFDKPLANYWLHSEYLLINNSKMSKSLNNFITLKTLQEKNISPLTFRYFALTANYRAKLNFTWDTINLMQKTFEKLQQEVIKIKTLAKNQKNKVSQQNIKKYLTKFTIAINNDLNTPQALAILWEVIKNSNLNMNEKEKIINEFDKVLGLKLADLKPLQIPAKITKLLEQRELYRRNKQFIQSDALRQKINDLGYDIEDTPQGPWLKKTN